MIGGTVLHDNWKDESLCFAIGKNARIQDFSFFQKWSFRFRLSTVGDAIRYGRQNLLKLKGFGKAYDKSLCEFIKNNDNDLHEKFIKNETYEFFRDEGFLL